MCPVRAHIWGNDGVELTALTPSFPRPDSRLRGNDVRGVRDMTWEGAGVTSGCAGYDGHVRVDGGMTERAAGMR